MPRLIAVLLIALSLQADARYKLAYHVKANGLIQIVAGLAGLSKMSSEGEEVLLKGSRLLVKGEKTSLLLDYASGQMIMIDHTDKTYERLRIEDMRQRIEADIPKPLIDGLKRLFPSGGSGVAVDVQVLRTGDVRKMRSLEAIRARHGLGYLLPAMESLVSLMPGIEKSLQTLRAGGELVEALQIQIGAGGKIVDSSVQILDYRETPVAESELAPPEGYTEVK